VRVLIRFLDNEVMEAESDAVNTERLGFPVRPTSGNNRLAWVSMAGLKYVSYPEVGLQSAPLGDPRELEGLDKLVIRFLDGEVLRAYRDDTFSHQGHGFLVRIWDAERGKLMRAVVSVHALKAIFTVDKWDSQGIDRPADSPVGGGAPVENGRLPSPGHPSPALALAHHPGAIGLPGGSFPGRYFR
jgi:hypothetical protein